MFATAIEPRPVERRGAAAAALQALAESDIGSLSEAALAEHLPALYRLKATLDATIVDAVGVFDGRKQHMHDGAFTASGWIAARAGVSRTAASVTVKVARQARHMDRCMDAARDGQLGFDKLRTLAAARGVSETTARAFDADEQRLLDKVSDHHVERGARVMRNWAAAADPDADEASHEDRQTKRKVNLSTSMDGMGFLDGLLTTEANAVVGSELEAIINDLHRWGLSTNADGHRPSAAQLRHDALVEMARRAAASATVVDVRRDARSRAAEETVARQDNQSGSEAGTEAGTSTGRSGAPIDVPATEAGEGSATDEVDGGSGATWNPSDTTDADDLSAADLPPEGSSEAPSPDESEANGPPHQPVPFGDDDLDPEAKVAPPATHRGPELLGPDDLDDERLEPVDEEHPECGCSSIGAAQGLFLPPGTGPPGRAGKSDKIAGGLGRPLFNVLVDLNTLEGRAPPDLLSRTAEIVGTGPIPTTTVQRLLCDAGVSRIVTRGRSLALDVGAVSRTATPAQWRALIAHAGGCEFPGCSAPWEWCQAHHLTHWSAEHRTALDGLALGCHGHHRLLHQPGWTMTRRPDLTIVVTRPDGTQLT